MAFKYSCFISYRNYKTGVNSRLINDLRTAVSEELSFHIAAPVYFDEERLDPGDLYNDELATALCQSLCMILAYTPRYFDLTQTYCAREYKAMEALETKRLNSVKDPDLKRKGLIIPIVIRGEDNLPAEIKNKRQYWNFGKIHLGDPQITSHPQYGSKICEIAERIGGLYKAFETLPDLNGNCHDYKLPLEEDIKPWLEQIIANPKFPLRKDDAGTSSSE